MTLPHLECVLLGAGGHAKVVIDCLRSSSNSQQLDLVALDQTAGMWGTSIMGIPIVGDDEMLPKLVARGVGYFICCLAGKNEIRARLFEAASQLGLRPMSVRHSSAIVSPYAQVEEGCQLLPACVVNAGARIGANVIINTAAVIEHDCSVADHAHIATGARLAGGVRVGRGAFIGAGATVKQTLCIGERAVVGAGAVVIREVEPAAVVAGVPARVIK